MAATEVSLAPGHVVLADTLAPVASDHGVTFPPTTYACSCGLSTQSQREILDHAHDVAPGGPILSG